MVTNKEEVLPEIEKLAAEAGLKIVSTISRNAYYKEFKVLLL